MALGLIMAAPPGAAERRVISRPRDRISDLILFGDPEQVAFNWRDGEREGSSIIDEDGRERTGPPGLVSTVHGLTRSTAPSPTATAAG